MKTRNSSDIVPGVSRYFRFDWQFAIELSQTIGLRFISLLFLAIPFIIDTSKVNLLNIPLLIYLASFLFFVSYLIVALISPVFIRQYRDFGKYLERHHSHRWIVWEFFHNLPNLKNSNSIVKETVSKELAGEVKDLNDATIRKKIEELFAASNSEHNIVVLKPKVFKRDIYLPMRICDQNYVLSMEEDDNKLDKKEKELFWIIFTLAAKQRLLARIAYWLLVYSSICLFTYSMLEIITQFASS